jgi:hypothetical protein
MNRKLSRILGLIAVAGGAFAGAATAEFVVPSADAAAPLGVAEGLTVVPITDHSAYWANAFGIGLVDGDASKGPGLLVIRGVIQNDAGGLLDHVKFAFELLDGRGRVVASEVGYNRSSEMLRAIESPIPWTANDPPQMPIPRGGTDTFRMLFLRNETPPFESYRVRVVEAEFGEER